MAEIKSPAGEIAWVEYCDASGAPRFLVTSKAARDFYYLYEAVGGRWVKKGKDKDPSALARKFDVLKIIHGEALKTL